MKFNKYLLYLSSLVIALIWLWVSTFPDSNLHIIACDVGQGDAILITYKSSQFLIDGGANNRILDCLSSYMPFWDREIEVIVLTHPQADHYTGLIEVARRYKVDEFLANGLDSGTRGYEVLKNAVGGGHTKVLNPVVGTTIGNSMIHIDVLHPSEEYLAENTSGVISMEGGGDARVLGSYSSRKDPNNFSIVLGLSFGDFDAILTGDIPGNLLDDIEIDYEKAYEYIKVPHHGSKSGLTQDFLRKINPKVGVISVGKNSYGHPSDEIVEMLKENKTMVLRTDEMGDIEVISDGKSFWIEK